MAKKLKDTPDKTIEVVDDEIKEEGIIDKELEAMFIIADTLRDIHVHSRNRVLLWVNKAFGSEGDPEQKKGNGLPKGIVSNTKIAIQAAEATAKLAEEHRIISVEHVVEKFGLTVSGGQQRLQAATKRGYLQRVAPGLYSLPGEKDYPQLHSALQNMGFSPANAKELAELTIRTHGDAPFEVLLRKALKPGDMMASSHGEKR